jgi:hypothetical protein
MWAYTTVARPAQIAIPAQELQIIGKAVPYDPAVEVPASTATVSPPAAPVRTVVINVIERQERHGGFATAGALLPVMGDHLVALLTTVPVLRLASLLGAGFTLSQSRTRFSTTASAGPLLLPATVTSAIVTDTFFAVRHARFPRGARATLQA